MENISTPSVVVVKLHVAPHFINVIEVLARLEGELCLYTTYFDQNCEFAAGGWFWQAAELTGDLVIPESWMELLKQGADLPVGRVSRAVPFDELIDLQSDCVDAYGHCC